MKKIIAASDLSASSNKVAQRATQLAAACSWPGALLHVMDPRVIEATRRWMDAGPDMAERINAKALSALSAQAEAAAGQWPGGRLEPQLDQGNVVDQILAAATADDLLVVGSHSESVLHRLFLGNSARRLIYQRHGPILLVRREQVAPYHKVLLCHDFSASATQALQRLLALLPEAQIDVVHVVSELLANTMNFARVDPSLISEYGQRARQRATQDLQQSLQSLGAAGQRVKPVVLMGDPVHVIRAHAQEQGAALVVLGKQGQSALGDRLLGSVSQGLLQGAAVEGEQFDVLLECL